MQGESEKEYKEKCNMTEQRSEFIQSSSTRYDHLYSMLCAVSLEMVKEKDLLKDGSDE